MNRSISYLILAISTLASLMLVACDKDKLSDGLPDGYSSYSTYHQAGWSEGEMHGAGYLTDLESCNYCHGIEEAGGKTGVSCQSCHSSWQNNCNFCHGGGPGNTTAAPTTGDAAGSHKAHVINGMTHLAYDCNVCHKVPEELYAEGHLEDNPETDIVFGVEAGAEASYSDGKCSSVYCHGDAEGLTWGSTEALSCASCHGDETSLDRMPDSHKAHLDLDIGCTECHFDVVDENKKISERALHIDGKISVALKDCKSGLNSQGDSVPCSYDFETHNCTTSCHREREWGGDMHPDGWGARDMHGRAFVRAEASDCRSCHGEELDGGSSGVSCDTCHTSGSAAWRTTCTFCHGGTDTQSGAPPESVFGETDTSVQGVGAHTAHLAESDIHATYECTTCHTVPASFDAEGHINNEGEAKVRFDSFNPEGTYSGTNATCSALYCHGNGDENSAEVSWTLKGGVNCGSCHGDGSDEGQNMNVNHSIHVDWGLRCNACHNESVDLDNNFMDKTKHINGEVEVKLITGDWDEASHTCTNTCHDDSIW